MIERGCSLIPGWPDVSQFPDFRLRPASPEVVKKRWDYIKANNLQNAKNKRNILADGKLKAVFGKDEVTMFEMTGLVSKHLT